MFGALLRSFCSRLSLAAGLAVACVEPPPDAALLHPAVPLQAASEHGAASAQLLLKAGEQPGHFSLEVTLHALRSAGNVELKRVSAWMPTHGHFSPPPEVSSTASGYRVDELIFSMPGRWNIDLELQSSGIEDRLVVSVDVQ